MMSCGTTSKITSKKSSPKCWASSRNSRNRRLSMAPHLLLTIVAQPKYWAHPLSRAQRGVAQLGGAPDAVFPGKERLQRLVHVLFLFDGHGEKARVRDRAQLFVQRAPRRIEGLHPPIEGRLIPIADLAIAD